MAKLLLQERIDEIVKEIITPELKKFGFKKSSRNYYKELEHFGLCFNIQSSLYNNDMGIKFTFNTGIFVPGLYCIYYNTDILKFPKEYECFNRKRIGELMSKSDYWYSISEDTNLDTLKRQIKNHIEEFVIPHLSDFAKDKDIIDLYNNGSYLKAPYDYAFLAGFLVLYGDRDQGIKLLREHYYKFSNEAYGETIQKYANKLGIII